MPLQSSLPKGSAGIRGCSDVPHLKSLGGQTANQANRLYMHTVRRESLLNKRQGLKVRLAEIDQQLRGIEAGIRETAGKYRKNFQPRRKKPAAEEGNGSRHHKMKLNF